MSCAAESRAALILVPDGKEKENSYNNKKRHKDAVRWCSVASDSHPSAIILLTNSLASRTFCLVALTVRPLFQVRTWSEKVIMLKWSPSLRSARMVLMACLVYWEEWLGLVPDVTLSLQNVQDVKLKDAKIYITCWIFVPIIEPLTSMTKMTSLGTTGSPFGAK